IGAGVTLALAGGSSPARVAAPSSPGTNRSPLDASAIAAKVDKGVVDITAQEAYGGGQALGTGMILTSSGEVLTNNHVIDGSASISVRPVDGQKSYPATVIGVDRTDDVALLQMQRASGLTPVRLGDSSKVKVGTRVVAIGNALGLGGKPTVTQGAITALNRSVTASDENGSNPENLTGMLQTSAHLASGDSGGPLVNAAGKVIGMDTAAPGGQLSAQGFGTPSIGWAIPSNKAFSVVSLIRSHSSNPKILLGPRPFIGVSVEDASQAARQAQQGGTGVFRGPFEDLPTPAVSSGAYVNGTVSGSPADGAGLQRGDVITSFDGHAVKGEADLTNLESSMHPGSSVSIGWVDPSGQSHSATITLGTGPAA
ncbi:MAG: trypsin-like peptidase domain-containing protein, partial [Acidimicrobiales bacterium]|nr:trypsin-like peptidase domain-containing protein [Acidimicrobiales bacterium]